MIIVRLTGGLGNQMFQYAFGKSLAEQLKQQIKLDILGYKNDLLRTYDLPHFSIKADIASKHELKWLRNEYKFLDLLFWTLLKFGVRKIGRFTIIKEIEPFVRQIDDLSNKENIYLIGDWQNENYFKKIKEIIIKDFSFKTEIKGQNLEIANQIAMTNSVSIHIRRGDYILNKETNKIHGICSVDYYMNAIEIIETKIKQPTFFIFSDDTAWVKENFKIKNAVYVTHNSGLSAPQDMRLMMLCHHNIIANSSFSWWAAWLNTNPNKIVIAPQKWFVSNLFNTSELIPKDWIRI